MNSKKQPPKVFYKYEQAVLKNFSILTGKYLCSSVFLIKLRVFRSATVLKRDSKAGVFLILKKICERLLLNNVKRNYSSMKIVKYVLNVSQHLQENTFTGGKRYILSFLINISCRMQLRSIFIQKEVPTLVFSWQLSEIFNNNFFKERKKSIVMRKETLL